MIEELRLENKDQHAEVEKKIDQLETKIFVEIWLLYDKLTSQVIIEILENTNLFR